VEDFALARRSQHVDRMRSSDPALLGKRPSATSVELVWRVKAPPIPPRPRATPVAMPSMHDLTSIARRLAAAPSLPSGAARLARDVGKLLRLAEVACIWIDWPHGTAHTAAGTLDAQVAELVMEVAGSGRRSLVDNTLTSPGSAGARSTAQRCAVLASPGSAARSTAQRCAVLASPGSAGARSTAQRCAVLIEPLGPRPARAVLALRKPVGIEFDAAELTVIQTLAIGLAPHLDRLIIAHRAV
jgi:hypothetical protein